MGLYEHFVCGFIIFHNYNCNYVKKIDYSGKHSHFIAEMIQYSSFDKNGLKSAIFV